MQTQNVHCDGRDDQAREAKILQHAGHTPVDDVRAVVNHNETKHDELDGAQEVRSKGPAAVNGTVASAAAAAASAAHAQRVTLRAHRARRRACRHADGAIIFAALLVRVVLSQSTLGRGLSLAPPQ